jgi:F0F1-type ATP synthase delta subunit
MNYKFYAKALFEAFSEKEEKEFESFFGNFIQELKRKNRLQILPKILKEVGKYFDLAKKGNLTEVVVRDKRNFDS